MIKLFDLIEGLLEPKVEIRLDAVSALNHRFLTTDLDQNSKIKMGVLQELKTNWKKLALKD